MEKLSPSGRTAGLRFRRCNIARLAKRRLGVPSENVCIQEIPFGDCANPGAGLRPHFDHAFADQHLHRFAERVAAYAKLGREIALGRKCAVGIVVPAHDSASDLGDDSIVQGGSTERA